MLLIPDPETAFVDPVLQVPTLRSWSKISFPYLCSVPSDNAITEATMIAHFFR